MIAAMAFSFLGDVMGAAHSFIGQMSFFACAHVSMTVWFIRSSYKIRYRDNHSVVFLVLALLLSALFYIVPFSPEGVIRYGVIVYCLVIAAMLLSSFFLCNSSRHDKTRSLPVSLILLGSVSFVISDYILAWNKFVSPLDLENYLIMVPYYLGQLLIFTGTALLPERSSSVAA